MSQPRPRIDVGDVRSGEGGGRSRTANLPPTQFAPMFRGLVRFCAEFRPPDFVIDRIVQSARVLTLTGVTGTGKTEALKNIALAVATGRHDILNLQVQQGRVAVLALENPDDFRNRLLVSAHVLGIDFAEVDRQIVIADRREPPEEVLRRLQSFRKLPLSLVLIDTLQAFFDGKNVNDPVEAGEFIRRIRPFTSVDGRPTVIIAAHPIKTANQDQLIPYGSGAILNEVDGNLTLWRPPQSDVVTLHWSGKFRGMDFKPLRFRFEAGSSPGVIDSKGRELVLPMLRPIEGPSHTVAPASGSPTLRLLKTMIASPDAPQRAWADAVPCSQAMVRKHLASLLKRDLVEAAKGSWRATEAGRQEAAKCP